MKCFARNVLGVLLVLIIPANAFGQSGAFTYQGRLTEDGKAANGPYDFLMTLYDTATNGSVVGSSLFLNDVAVTNGLFTQVLDFGAFPFIGQPRWLEIWVRPGATNGPLTVLAPRQPLTAAPYALFAATAGTLLNPAIRNPTFIGTDTLAPLDFSVNNTRALRLEYNLEGPNIIGGFSQNFVAPYAVGATIAGGGGI